MSEPSQAQMPIKIIDPHVHLFDLQLGQYQWLRAGNPPHWPDKARICQNFSQADLALTNSVELAGFVHIEAGFDNAQPVREIEWLARIVTVPFKSIAYIDIASNNFEQDLEKLLLQPSVVGVRYILEEDGDDEILRLPKIHRHFALLAQHGLSFEFQAPLANNKTVDAFCQVLDKVPDLKVALPHAGLPPLSQSSTDSGSLQAKFKGWQQALCRLSEHSNIAIKLSGWEMQKRNWQFIDISPIIDEISRTFNDDNIMLASNFPLSLWRKPYQQSWQDYIELLGNSAQQYKWLYSNAQAWYGFK